MLLSIRAEGSDGADRSPWGSFWFEPAPFRDGGPVTPDRAMQLTAVNACVRILAESVASLPFVLQREEDDGGKTKVRDHWLYRLFAKRPNSYQNPYEFREMLQGHVAMRGNAYARIYGNASGEATDLIPTHPDRVKVEMLSETNWRYRVKNRDGTETLVNRGAMFHLRGLSGDGVVGYNPIEAARKALGAALAAQDYGARFFENDARPGGWIEYPGQFRDEETRKKFRESWQSMQTGENRGKTAVLEMGMKLHDIGLSNEDSQFIETRKFSTSEIARMWRIPPHMIGDLEKATFSNIEQQSLEFVIHTLTPWLVRWEQAIEWTFLEEDDLGVEFPTLSLLRGDAVARASYYHNGILDGWLTRNEARLAESRNPLPGLDEPLRPLNMVEETQAPDEMAETPPPAVPPRLPPAPDRGKARMNEMIAANVERVARKETGMVEVAIRKRTDLRATYRKHAHFVAALCSVPYTTAMTYCMTQYQYVTEHGDEITKEDFEDLTLARLYQLTHGQFNSLLEGTEPCDMHC